MLIPWREALKRPNKLGISFMSIAAFIFLTSWAVFPLNEHSDLFPTFSTVVMTYLALMATCLVLWFLGMLIWAISARRKWLMGQ
ncbi:hypothetical protein [Dictyobacter aurantiacus]|uniref:Uncharacterized protein n=1 Tax=Dictyobacter aurantiacus TaxID=1936993 RepID=A0A401ZBM3_9CHLR|nr:hypothetical protein [Dictyobacter aurantiacus]GCE04249.1 hypothetical protein KDAU_15780 [Dictyobacter aurantiacus]